MITIDNLTLQIGSRVLIDKSSTVISDGQKVGIVGKNGCGKSTLFKALQNKETDEIHIPSYMKIAFVEQTIIDTSLSIMAYVLSKDTELTRYRQALQTASPVDLPEIMEHLKMLNSDGAESRIAQILNGLGFQNDDLTRPVSDFSGGWRMRLSLAGALFQQSDILLLDEPTNHLDLEATIWLEDHLSKYKGTLLLISHDKMLLNRLCTHILHFDNQKLVMYRGNYDTFEQTRTEKRRLQLATQEKLLEKKAHLQSYIDRFRYKASKAKQAQSRIKMLAKMQDVSILSEEAKDVFYFPKPEKLSPPLITLDNVSTGYDTHIVLRKLSFNIGLNERIALLGKNGNGKSTLAKLLTGQLPVMEGTINRLSGLKIGYFGQHQEDDLPLDETPLNYFQTFLSDKTPTQVRSYLAGFGIDQDKALTPIAHLSGGEKARLIFARIAHEKPALLILDEPTNHLDMVGREALLDALNAFEGSVLLITHDFHLIELFADELWLIDNSKCTPYQGDLSDYRAFLLKKQEPIKSKPVISQQTNKLTPAQTRQIKAKIGQIERQINQLTLERELYQKQFETPLSKEQLININNQLKQIEIQLETYETQWFELTEQVM
ncbi:MAG: ABC-F family ATP-binding cassette domain-containing protein [Alphaproteobacteria bacterium]|nr:ABC-F family ATP-binding cassette domain-containing protein [Alphaproteobacteria bacterium]